MSRSADPSRTADQIRQDFIDFFVKRHGHTFVPSSPVVPHDDPTLLFTNAGMNQFKDVFLGTGSRPYRRAANTQKCIRAGGKHNDLDDVGHDTYHHTFFEMLGNWSFGDYFKKEAIGWAWELLTQVWGIAPEKLHATYFGGDPKENLAADAEARDLWLALLPPERVHAGSKKDNFWEMGETGPCGPCSEIHIDLTPDLSGAGLVNRGDARVMEIWNLVFIQFNRGPDGKLTPLPDKHVDTGMGFERVTAVLQGKRSNYDTDVFAPIFAAIQQVTGAAAYGGRLEERDAKLSNVEREALMRDIAYRVIADHIRTLTFALTDGAVPDKEGRGYVLRRILRRAVRYGWQYLNVHEPFLYKLVPAVVAALGPAFPELTANPQRVAGLVREEEESFGRTLSRGFTLFTEAVVDALVDGAQQQLGWRRADGTVAYWPEVVGLTDVHFETPEGVLKINLRDIPGRLARPATLTGATAFKLHDTYGFPIDLTEIMASEQGLRVDYAEYERLMDEARARAREGGRAARTAVAALPAELVTPFGPTDDAAKYSTDTLTANVRAIVCFGEEGAATVVTKPTDAATPGTEIGVVTDRTCFYGEQGGQVGDAGTLIAPGAELRIDDTVRVGETVLHVGVLVGGELRPGAGVTLKLDPRRQSVRRNHTATHLLNWALREVLGEHVQQKGSLVDAEKTRFDFAHPKSLTAAEAARVEDLVNERIKADLAVSDEQVPQAEALKINGLRAVFGEKYPDVVRVMSIGAPVSNLRAAPNSPQWRAHSIEFCGGTHCARTGEIEQFALVGEEAVAKGVRRVVGITGPQAKLAQETGAALLDYARKLREAGPEELERGAAELQTGLATATIPLRQRHTLRDETAEVQKLVKQQHKAQAAGATDVVLKRCQELAASAERIGPHAVVVAEMPEVPADQLKTGADALKQKLQSAVVLFGARAGDKALLLAAVTDDLVKKGVKAGDLVKQVAPLVGGGGGGAPTMAQAGGKNPEKLAEALAAGREWIKQRLAGP